MKTRSDFAVRGLLRLWLVFSVVWIVVVAFQTWRDIPQDDWVSVSEPTASQLTDAEVVLKPIVGIFDNPVARVVILDGIKLAFIPPILALACGSAYVWAFSKICAQKTKMTIRQARVSIPRRATTAA